MEKLILKGNKFIYASARVYRAEFVMDFGTSLHKTIHCTVYGIYAPLTKDEKKTIKQTLKAYHKTLTLHKPVRYYL